MLAADRLALRVAEANASYPAIPEVEQTGPGYYMPPLLDVRCVGSKRFWLAVTWLTNLDLRTRFTQAMGAKARQSAASLEDQGSASLFLIGMGTPGRGTEAAT